eukprot:220570_1
MNPVKTIDELKIVVAMASHISYDKQIPLLERALHSLSNQSKKCDILISISFSKDTFLQQFECIQMNQISDSIKICISKQQKFQMEHYRILALAQLFNVYDLVLFLDDDDKYTPDRVLEFAKAYVSGSVTIKANQKLAGVIERKQREEHHLDDTEYWGYGIVPEILNTFFERMSDDFDLLKHKYGDFVLREYFFRLDKSKVFIDLKPKSPLYLYTENNPNSVCGSKMDQFSIEKNLYLFAIDLGKCPTMRYCTPNILLQEIEDSFPQLEYAKVVFSFLYDDVEMHCRCKCIHAKLKQAALNELTNLKPKGSKMRRHVQTAMKEIQALPN